MQLIMLSAMIPELTGSAIQFTNTGSSGVLPLLGRSTGVFVEKATCIIKQGRRGGQPGKETTHCPFAAIVDPGDLYSYCLFWIFAQSFVGMVLKRELCVGLLFYAVKD